MCSLCEPTFVFSPWNEAISHVKTHLFHSHYMQAKVD
jgi:hypothetical protein